MTKTTSKKSKGKFAASSIIEGIAQPAQQQADQDSTAAQPEKKLEIRKQLVLSRALDEKVKKYILKESFERGQRLSFNGLIIELLEDLTKTTK